MNPITVDRPSWRDVCIVCTKSTTGGRGFAAIRVAGAEIFLCCPGCTERFDAERDRYLARRESLEPNDLGKIP
jgi:hypothetical protein